MAPAKGMPKTVAERAVAMADSIVIIQPATAITISTNESAMDETPLQIMTKKPEIASAAPTPYGGAHGG